MPESAPTSTAPQAREKPRVVTLRAANPAYRRRYAVDHDAHVLAYQIAYVRELLRTWAGIICCPSMFDPLIDDIAHAAFTHR